MLVLDDSSPAALVVDKALPASSARVHEALVRTWPRLSGRITFVAGALDDVEIQSTDVVVSSHACGRLTDLVLDLAVAAGARVAVLPCCHDLATCDAGELSGWVDGPVAIDIMRAVRLEQRGYRIWTQSIPASCHTEEPAAARRSGCVAPSNAVGTRISRISSDGTRISRISSDGTRISRISSRDANLADLLNGTRISRIFFNGTRISGFNGTRISRIFSTGRDSILQRNADLGDHRTP